jgi:hypothetical protein
MQQSGKITTKCGIGEEHYRSILILIEISATSEVYKKKLPRQLRIFSPKNGHAKSHARTGNSDDTKRDRI